MKRLAYAFADGEFHVMAADAPLDKAREDLRRLFDEDDGARLVEVEIAELREIREPTDG